MNPKKPLLSAEHIVKNYKTPGGLVHALNDVSLEIYEGESLALVGESGCGKSTLGKVLIALEKATAGEITFCGKRFSELKKKEMHQLRKDMQIVFQDPFSSLDPRMTIRDIVAEPLKAYHVFRNPQEMTLYVESLLEKVGIRKEYSQRYPHQFSGGQRQRICIARAIALKPKFVVCDEPVSALDVSVQAQLLNLMQELRLEFGLTYLFVSHDLAVVRYISDRVCVMFLGNLCEIGTTEEIFTNPRHPYSYYLLSSTPVPDPEQRRDSHNMLLGEPPSPIHPPSGCAFRTRCPYATEICAKEAPVLKEQFGHMLACHHPLNEEESRL